MAESMQEAFQQAGVDGSSSDNGTAPTDRRSVMEKAFSDLEAKSEEQPVVKSGESSAATTTDEVVVVKEEPKKVEKLPDLKRPGEKAKPGEQKVDLQQKAKVGEQKTTVVEGKFKPPVSWKPSAREHWAKIPSEAQEEISRRETEISRALSESAQARKFGGEFHNAVKPYEQLIRASNVTPIQAISNLMNTAAVLQTGTQGQKCATIANIIKTYGIDLKELDAFLAGQAPAKESRVKDEVLQTVRGELAPVREFINEVRGSRQQSEQRINSDAVSELETFAADPENEFYSDLSEDIADFLESSAKRGRVMTLKEAYNRAAAIHPEISKVVSQRAADAAKLARAQSLESKRRAASSQTGGSPGGMGSPQGKPGNRREAIGMAWDKLSGN